MLNQAFSLQRRGYITLQVPDLSINFNAQATVVTQETPSQQEIHPEWFWQIKDGRLAIGKEQGFLHWSEKGYRANKEEIRKNFEAALKDGNDRTSGRGWAAFEEHAEEFFKSVRARTEKHIKKLEENLRLANKAKKEGF